MEWGPLSASYKFRERIIIMMYPRIQGIKRTSQILHQIDLPQAIIFFSYSSIIYDCGKKEILSIVINEFFQGTKDRSTFEKERQIIYKHTSRIFTQTLDFSICREILLNFFKQHVLKNLFHFSGPINLFICLL